MNAMEDFLLNGRTAGVMGHTMDLAMSSVCAPCTASNYWSSSENSQTNAWNVNFTSGNVNGNNKYNTNYVRAVSALGQEIKEGWGVAYMECCANKRMSEQCIMYRQVASVDLYRLAVEVEQRTYRPSASYCFVVTRPRLREIFAANFRDRIVQHWITMRLEPLFEERFRSQGDVSFNCRKGFGTKACAERVAQEMERVSDGYRKEAWIGKFDIRSFFMSIDKRILWERLKAFIVGKYKGGDIDTLLWLTEVTIFHCPQDNCVRRGRLRLWDRLPAHKSLFGSDPMVGLPIGNITSQLMANFHLSFLDGVMVEECRKRGGAYIRFVDDFAVVAPTKADVLALRYIASAELSGIGLTMHRDKIYVQKATHGVKMVGSVVKPHRIYTQNSTIAHFADALRKASKVCREGRADRYPHILATLNSMSGFLRHTASYNRKLELIRNFTAPDFWKVFYGTSHLNTFRIRRKSANHDRV